MTLQEILKSKGMSDEDITSVIGEMKQNKIFTASEENLDVRYGKLKTDHEELTKKHGESENLIKQLQEATKGQEEVQTKITQYEATIKQLQDEAQEAKTESALKIGLLSAGAKAGDIDYLIYRMSHDSDWKPELGDDGQVKGLDDKVKGLKTQFPNQFETSKQKKVEEKKLEKPDDDSKVSKEDFARMGYQAKLKLFNENPDLYKQLNDD